jgi:predicted AlkP superfamily pyrophosphatase or phosphodiesterase
VTESRAATGRPVLAVFLDGLGADSVRHMPFLSAQGTVERVRTELGYSITCHASMYTGLRPDRHGLWFVWQRRPESSPFRWLRPFRALDVIDNLPMHVLATKITRRFVHTTSWFGIPYPVHVRWRDIPDLDIAERKLWPDPGYLAPAATIFDTMRAHRTTFEIVGMTRGHAAGLAGIEAWTAPTSPAQFTYLFAGDIDHASHAHGQKSQRVRDLLGRVDEAIEAKHGEVTRRLGEEPALLVWSDHGHHDVQRMNPLVELEKHRIPLRRYPHVIDTNFLRMWIDDAAERADVAGRLDELGIGHVLTDDELRRHRVSMPDDRYGNLIFYLDVPWAFSHTIWGFGRRLASGHGYLPDHPGSDAVLVSNLPTREGPLDLVDLAPSVLELLGLPIAPALDGRSVWSSTYPG